MSPKQTTKLGAFALATALLPAVFSASAIAASATRTTAFDYDAASGLLSKEIIEPDDPDLCVVTTYQRDDYGNKTVSVTRNCNGSQGSSPPNNSEATAPGGLAVFAPRQATVAYADPRFATSATNALSQTESRTYSAAFGMVTSLTGPNQLTTAWAYDGFGRKTLERRADGNGTQWTYQLCTTVPGGAASCPITGGVAAMYVVTSIPVAGPIDINAGTVGPQNGAYSKTYYDAQGRTMRVETQGFDGTASRLVFQDTEYDRLGQIARKSLAYYAGDTVYWTNYGYDLLGRAVQTNMPDGGQATNGYDGLTTSATVKVLDAASSYGPSTQTTSQTRNLVGQIVKVTDANGKVLTRGFDPFGNMVWSADALGNVTASSYDVRGRKKAMQDPDMGAWSYTYNALGELVQQINAKNQTFTQTFDLLGRMTSRTEPDLVSTWVYDRYRDDSSCSKGIGNLCEAYTSTGYTRRHGFDAYGRPASTVTTLGTSSYTTGASYDANGRVDVQTYPTGMQVRNGYTTLGYLKQISNVSSGTVYWLANAVDAQGRVTQHTLGNGLVGASVFDAATGRLKNSYAGPANAVQNVAYAYDYLGNLRSRSDTATGVSAQYDYDALNRLRVETRAGGGLSGPQSIIWTYNDIGNLTTRSDVGIYSYPGSGSGSVRPHAVSSVTGTVNGMANPSYSYDANGNLASGGGRTLTWMSFDMPSNVTRGSASLDWHYGPEHERVRETYKLSGTVQRVTTYLSPGAGAGLYYEEETGAAGTRQKHFISAGGSTVAVATYNGSSWSTQYWHKDHLGSTSVVTNESGAVQERLDYEPFGKRRYADGLTDSAGTLASSTTDRGYTGHEMLEEVGLVHMNGRIYDPALARFMSADPLIQSPASMQSFNRYTYGWNNPLGGTDPSGYSWLSERWHAAWHSTVGRIVITVAVAYFTGQYAGDWLVSNNVAWATASSGGTTVYSTTVLSTAGNIAVGAAGGFAGGFVGSGGNLRQGFEGAVTGAGFGWAGGIGQEGSAARYAAHAAVGCASGAMGGNGCARGATSAYASKWATVHTADWSGPAQFMATIVAGGTTSAIGGGRFANGALSAAYGYLFNELMHSGYGGSEADRRGRAGYQSDNYVSSGYHEYHVETVICDVSQVGCTEQAVFDQLRRYPAPQRFGAPDRDVGVNNGDQSFALSVGMVKHWVGNRLVVNMTLSYEHILDPGVVFRSVVTAGNQIIVRTDGYGYGLFPQINSGRAANLIWSVRTDSKIKAALGF